MHPHIPADQWRRWFQSGHILRGDDPMPMDKIVRGGEQYRHLFPDDVEPDVDPNVVILYEDESLIAVHKPAPLPVHPCGRFHLNTMISLLGRVFDPGELRLVHRLDANTTGIMILARTRESATNLRRQFQGNQVRKHYLVACAGHPHRERFWRDDRIGKHRTKSGTRIVDAAGDPARTEFRVLRRLDDGTSLLRARPWTGRTNQIRIHLWAMGMPVVGDPSYCRDRQLGSTQTLSLEHPPMQLHASGLRLQHPSSGQPLAVEAPPPAWIRRFGSTWQAETRSAGAARG